MITIEIVKIFHSIGEKYLSKARESFDKGNFNDSVIYLEMSTEILHTLSNILYTYGIKEALNP